MAGSHLAGAGGVGSITIPTRQASRCDQIAKIAALVDTAAIRPVIGGIVPFDQTPEALTALSKGGVRGKVVISYR